MDAIQFHSEISQKFDAHYRSSRFEERLSTWTGLIDEYLKNGHTVLDAGCGNGILSFYAARHGATVMAFDGSEKMIELCMDRLLENNAGNIHFSVNSLPLDDSSLSGKYDLILSSSVLEYVSDYGACINSFSARLKDDGLLIVSLPNRESFYRKLEKFTFSMIGRPRYVRYVKNTMSMREFTSRMKSYGFDIVKMIPYSSSNFINNFLRRILFTQEQRSTLFVAVCKKVSSNIIHEMPIKI